MLMKKAKLFISALFLMLGVTLSAQNVTVKGTVRDASTGDGVPFAAIQVKGTSTGIATDANGVYSMTVPSNATLVFSSIGYITEETAVNGRSVIDVALKPDTEVLEGTVVVGYGSARKVGNLVGSVSTVRSDVLKNAPSASALDNLQGQVAGLSVLSYSGVAGDNAVSMQLHGVGSLGTSSTPLFVIDGIPSSSRSVMAMNPNDIESISVLKDASATSIYGSRAANGVVYISTKNGSYNERATVTVRSQYGVSTLASTRLYENMMSADELKDFWIRTGLHSAQWIKTNYTDKGWDADTQWYKYMMDVINPQSQNDVTIEGGGQKVAYMIGASQFSQKGFTPGNFFDRYTLRSNVQAHPLNWLKTGVNLNLSLDNTQQNAYWGSAANGMSNNTNGGLSYLLLPFYPAVDENGEMYKDLFPGMNRTNPRFMAENVTDQYDRYGVNGNVYVEIEPIRNLKLVSRAGVDGYLRANNWGVNPEYAAKYGTRAGANPLTGNASAMTGKSTAIEYSATITNTIEYSFDVAEDHHISLLVGQEGVDNDYRYFYAQSTGQKDNRQQRLQDGLNSTYAMSQSSTQSRFLSFFGHAEYNLMNKYIIDGTLRNDTSSRFGKDNRSAWFWSVGAMWKLKKENFLQSASAVNDLNLKVSYGTQGNAAIGDYNALGLIGASGSYNDVSARYLTQPANPELAWEQQNLFTIALTGRMFNRLDFDIEFYNRQTKNMLMDVPQPYTTGFDDDSIDITKNVGGMRNRGVDLTLGYDILRGRDYFLRFNTTFNYNDQAITELFDGRQRWTIASTGITYVVGKPVMFYYPMYAGVDPEDGKPMWYLPGEDNTITQMDPEKTTKVWDSDALEQNSGKVRYAPINGGFGLSGGWKGFSVQADFAYVLGKTLISNDGYFYCNPSNFNTFNTIKDASDFWTPTNKDAKYPDWSKGVTMQFDSHLLENANFLRLKNLQVAYSLPAAALGWQNVVKGLKFTVTGRNLLTFTKYSGIDPEINSNLSYGVAGNSKQILGGIELTF